MHWYIISLLAFVWVCLFVLVVLFCFLHVACNGIDLLIMFIIQIVVLYL